MKGRLFRIGLCLATSLALVNTYLLTFPAQTNTGTIEGHIRLNGRPPGNPVIRMGVDPLCSQINAGKRIAQETVITGAAGELANVFVRIQGTFPSTPVPKEAVILSQTGCVYRPRVVGLRVGQILQIKNSDPLPHNLHGLSSRSNGFNVGQPSTGSVYSFRPKDEETMLQLKCDIHRWMTAYIGIVRHPYFAVSDASGAFEIDKVPVGTYPIEAWHERYGTVTSSVRVKAGATTIADFTYSEPRRSGSLE